MRSAHRDRLIFWAQVALGVVGVALATAALVAAAGAVHRAPGTHRVSVAGLRLTYPTVNAAAAVLLALAGLGVLVLGTIVRSALRQYRAQRGLVRGIPVLGPLDGYPGVSVIDDPGPHAFCLGYLRPRVYVSQGALALLSPAELAAVLSHEDRHRSTRDPLRFACARLLSDALFFLPALRPLGARYEELAEQRADEAAVRSSAGDRGPLAAALLAFEASSPSARISDERVDALLGQPPRWRAPLPLIALSLAALGVGVVLVWRVSGAAAAHATFNLPVISSQPCILMLALLPMSVLVAACVRRRRLAGD